MELVFIARTIEPDESHMFVDWREMEKPLGNGELRPKS